MATSIKDEGACFVTADTLSDSEEAESQVNDAESPSGNYVNSFVDEILQPQTPNSHSTGNASLQNGFTDTEWNSTTTFMEQASSSNATVMMGNFAHSHLASGIPEVDHSVSLNTIGPDPLATEPSVVDPLSFDNLALLYPEIVFQPIYLPAQPEVIEEEVNTSDRPNEHNTHDSSGNEPQSSNWSTQPDAVNMNWNGNAELLSDTNQQEFVSTPIHSERVDISNVDATGYRHQNFETDQQIQEDPMSQPATRVNNCNVHGATGSSRSIHLSEQEFINFQHVQQSSLLSVGDDELCCGQSMFVWLLDCIRWLNLEITKESPSKDALRTTLIPLEQAFNVIQDAHYEFINEMFSTFHQNHHHSYCKLQPIPAEEDVRSAVNQNHNQSNGNADMEEITLG